MGTDGLQRKKKRIDTGNKKKEEKIFFEWRSRDKKGR